jgi:Protein of unknown function (DUF3313)
MKKDSRRYDAVAMARFTNYGSASMLLSWHRHPRVSAMAAAIILAVASLSHADTNSSSSPFPGLELANSRGIDRLYRRPDVDPSTYSKILIGEPLIEFSKNWKPGNYGRFGLSAQQLKRIRVDFAALAKDTFTKVLGEGGYEIVTSAADDVLEITPNIAELYINAPDVPSAGRTRTYTMEAGSATLVLMVSDAVTGTLLAVAYDRERSQSSTMRWSSSVSNRAAASAMLTGWAEQVKRELDAVRAK